MSRKDVRFRTVALTVFLVAAILPVGIAMERTGAAAFVARGMMGLLGNAPHLLVFAAVGLLATLFSLFMSNVAATVLLVPLVTVIGAKAGILSIDPVNSAVKQVKLQLQCYSRIQAPLPSTVLRRARAAVVEPTPSRRRRS